MFSKFIVAAATALLSCRSTNAQTFTSCNPLYSNTALGKAIDVDFTKGAVNSFQASGYPTYDSSGVHFTVAKSGDSPTLTSLFYIMFGKVEITMKAAPGAGIVSTLVLQSDDLDEIDMEWLGADGTEVQTNYFGKGDTSTYDRGAFNPAPNNQNEFITYIVEWTSSQVTWSVGGTVVRVLTPATADSNQYPQTPMQIKFGAWSGGDPSNSQGTINWARGPTDYASGPYTMTVQSLAVTDYSTGSQYKYGDTSGTWGSIQAVGGQVNGNANSAAAPAPEAPAPAATSASPAIPAGFGTSNSDTIVKTGWPWVSNPTTMSTAIPAYTSVAGVPSGWIITASGKIVPAQSAANPQPSTLFSSVVPSPSPSSPPSPGDGLEAIAGWDDKGFPTTRTVVAGWETMVKSYNQQGFLITPTPTIAGPTGVAAVADLAGVSNGVNIAKAVDTSTSRAAGEKRAVPTLLALAAGFAAAYEGLLLV